MNDQQQECYSQQNKYRAAAAEDNTEDKERIDRDILQTAAALCALNENADEQEQCKCVRILEIAG